MVVEEISCFTNKMFPKYGKYSLLSHKLTLYLFFLEIDDLFNLNELMMLCRSVMLL